MVLKLAFSAISSWATKHARLLVVLGVLAVAGALFAAGWYIHGVVWQQGYTARLNEEKAAQKEAADAARKEIINIGEKYEKPKQKIMESGDSGYGVGDRVSNALDWLHSNTGNQNTR